MDEITGFTGTAYQFSESTTGNIRVTIQPKSDKPDVLVEAMIFDIETIKFLEEGFASKIKPLTPFMYDIGDQVTDKFSKLTGLISSRAYFINGCKHYLVVLPITKDGDMKAHWLSEESLELTKPKKVKTKKTNTGGPIARGMIR